MNDTADAGFLRFNKGPPKIRLTGEDSEPDPLFYDHLIEEGFDVEYLAYNGGGKPYRDRLKSLSDDLELGENYGIVAFGDAASACLEVHQKPQPHLAALVAYYPSTIPNPKTKYPPHLHLLSHFAGQQGFPAVAWPSYTYRGVQPGFAEHDLDEFDKIAASLSWTRTLGLLRKAFNIDINLEKTWEAHLTAKYAHKDALAMMKTMVDHQPCVNHVPTLTGGLGQKDLYLFYRDYFLSNPTTGNLTPPSLSLKLLSRTCGTDRLVDELLITFTHTHPIPHILPGVPPTGKDVRIAAVSVVNIRGGKLVHEQLYWDQASVLVQVGLLDPKVIPAGMKGKGMTRLPVYGAEVAGKVVDEASEGVSFNELIPGWEDRPRGDPGVQRSGSKPAAGSSSSER